MSLRKLLVAGAFSLIIASAACGSANSSSASVPVTTSPGTDVLSKAMSRLHGFYTQSSGLYSTTGWWNSANGITILADYEALRGDKTYEADINNTFALNKAGGFLNKFYDDEGWWALAWIAAYDRTQNAAYLSMAESIFTDMTGGWDAICGGGIWWSKDRNYKNAIANELFLSVAAALANREQGKAAIEYGTWAAKEWKWFSASGMINPQHLINDGLTSACVNNGQPTYTYNQGVILGGLADLAKLQSDPTLLTTAGLIGNAAITRLVDSQGILHDPCEIHCGGDGPQFKGIFVRNLQALQSAAPEDAFSAFLQRNAASLQANDTSDGQFGLIWTGPYSDGTASSHMSGLDLLIAAEAARPKN